MTCIYKYYLTCRYIYTYDMHVHIAIHTDTYIRVPINELNFINNMFF